MFLTERFSPPRRIFCSGFSPRSGCWDIFTGENSGILRGYLFAGFLLGALACHFSVSRFFVRWGTEILKGCGKILSMPLKGIKKATKRLKFRMFRFRIYWYNRFHVDKGPRGRWFHNRDGKHEKREKTKTAEKTAAARQSKRTILGSQQWSAF